MDDAEALIIDMAQADPVGLASLDSGGKYLIPPHIERLNQLLLDVADGKIKRLRVSMPPRHGKSELISKYFVAWYIATHPDQRIILASYGSDFAASWGRKARNVLETWGPPVFGIEIAHDSSAADHWDIEDRSGGCVTAGVGSGITGRGANCLVGETGVITERGTITIGDLVGTYKEGSRDNWPRVLSYDHIGGIPEWRHITAFRSVGDRPILEVQTSSGHKVRATPEHRFFVLQQGYKEARNLRPGDKLIVARAWEQQDVRPLRDAEKHRWGSMLGMLPEASQGNSRPAVHPMRKGVREAALRVSTGAQEWAQGCLLLRGMHAGSHGGEVQSEVPDLWENDTSSQKDEVLLPSLPPRSQAQEDQVMPRMRRAVCPEIASDAVLLQAMCQCGALQKDDRQGQLPLQERDQLRKVVRRNEAIHTGEGWLCLCSMRREEEGLSYPSPERGRERQPAGESDHDVRFMSYYAPQIREDTVSSISIIGGEPVPVYDIQVEGSHNFFADSVLVHNCLIIDDPVKDAAEAQSETIRETAWEWYRGTAYTRLEPDGAVIEIQTRWHEDDLAGKLEAEEKNDGDQWVKLVLPAIAEEDDPLGRAPGEALWPERYPIERLKEIAKTLGSYLFAAEFQQRPQPAGGAIFKREDFRYFEKDGQYYVLHKKNGDVRVPTRKCWIFQTVDPSGSSSEQADYFVVMTLAVTPDYELLVLDVDRQRVDTTSHEVIMGNNRAKHHPVYQAVENKTFGTNIIQSLIKKGWPIRKLDAESDKVTRSRTVQARQEAEGVFFLAGAVWLEPLESELLKFPKDKHDDQVDCLSYAGIKISEEENGQLFSW